MGAYPPPARQLLYRPSSTPFITAPPAIVMRLQLSWHHESSVCPLAIQRLRNERDCEIAASALRGVGVQEGTPDPLRDRDSGSG